MRHDIALAEGNDNRSAQIQLLRELIAALDRRVPQIERAGEIRIACDAALLRDQALSRIAELES